VSGEDRVLQCGKLGEFGNDPTCEVTSFLAENRIVYGYTSIRQKLWGKQYVRQLARNMAKKCRDLLPE